MTGVLREKEGQLLLGDSEGKTTPIAKEDIEEMSPSALSTMPLGLIEPLADQERIDLMTYLLRSPPSMPLERPNLAPPLRTASEVAKVLEGSVTDGLETLLSRWSLLPDRRITAPTNMITQPS